MSKSDTFPGRLLSPQPADLTRLLAAVREMRCVSVVGVSNAGKSALLRAVGDNETLQQYLGAAAADYLPIYIDFNHMLEMTEQAFYELVLRCALTALEGQHQPNHEEVLHRVQAAYVGVVKPASSFEAPLSFAQAMAAIGDLLPERAVFLFDELDGPASGISGRVFLNLRALKDRHRAGLTYVTATNRRLEHLSQDPDFAEFAELFSRHLFYVSFMDEAQVAGFAARFAAQRGVTFSEEDCNFIRQWAGGHPGLTEAICHLLGALTGRPVRDPSQDWIIHRRAAELIPQDTNTQTECRNIWLDLLPQEQEALIGFLRNEADKALPGLDSVAAKHLLVGTGPERRIFARAFAEYVQRQHIAQRAGRPGLRLDPDSGEVWVDGVQVPPLTNLENRLLLLLYGRLGKIVTKYEVVEAVWGEDYIDEVDDARIEKLVSRLRQKIEPDVANPRYLITVRGRGYKLVEG